MRRGMFLIGICLVLLGLPVSFRARQACQWVETQGEAALARVTTEEAQRLALRSARARAVEQVAGVLIGEHTIIRDTAMAGEFVRAMADGYVLEEEPHWEQPVVFHPDPGVPPLLSYRVSLRACVAQSGARDPYFQVSAKLNKTTFVATEQPTLQVQCSRECYLTIFNLTAEDRFKLLLPNAYQEAAAHLQPSETYVFPPPDSDLFLAVEPLPGHRQDTEAILIVATKQQFDAPAQMGQREDLPMGDVFKMLLDLPASERAEAFVAYEVRAQ